MGKSLKLIKVSLLLVAIAALALSVSWIISSSRSASAAENDPVQECYYNLEEQLVCPIDQTDDKVPTDNCNPNSDRVCQEETEQNDDPVEESTPQVLGASTESAETFAGK